jgi:hypothetical protein
MTDSSAHRQRTPKELDQCRPQAGERQARPLLFSGSGHDKLPITFEVDYVVGIRYLKARNEVTLAFLEKAMSLLCEDGKPRSVHRGFVPYAA